MRLPTGTVISVQAVLFDMDGTLVDSHDAVITTWRRWAARHGLDADTLIATVHGRRSEDTVRRFAPATADIAAEIAWLEEQELAARDGIVAVPGAREFVAALPANRIAVVTSAPRALAEMRLRVAGIPLPAVFVGAEDVFRGKPDPEGYIKAARCLHFERRDCLIIEDAIVGLEAGRSSGARVLALATTLDIDALKSWDWVKDMNSLRQSSTSGQITITVQ